MLRILASLVVIAVALSLASAAPAVAATTSASSRSKSAHPHKARPATRRHSARRWHGYGFLPGYRPPEVIEGEREARSYMSGRFYAIPSPRFYQGRWNGGGFGPCYTYTPIGPVWNCGR